jgi:hypothetical protein
MKHLGPMGASTLTGERNIGMLQSKRTRAIPAGHGLR